MGKKTDTKRLVILDAHAILHRAYHALPDFSSTTGEPTGALYGLVAMLLSIIKELKPDYLTAAYDLPKPTYRHAAFDDYKAGRKEADEELVAQIKRSRDIFSVFNIPIYEHEGFEADDIIGTIVEQTKSKKKLEVVVASGDLDTLQLVENKRVQVYTLKKGIKDTILYDEEAVKERFGFGPELLPDYKGLRGDPSDNIPGIKGIGEKSATELIIAFGGIEDIYAALEKDETQFEKNGIKARVVNLLKEGKEEAEFSQMLAEIHRDVPVDFVLSKREWRDGLDAKAVLTLFAELGFRTLSNRVRDMFGVVEEEKGALFDDDREEPSAREIREVGVALWLLNSDITHPSPRDILQFAHTDSFTKAREYIFSELKKQALKNVYDEIEKPIVSVIERMQERGMKIDTVFLKKLSKEYHTELSKIETRIYKHAGGEFNINSPKQLADVLYDTLRLKNTKKTTTGQRSTRESELQKIADAHPIIPELLRYRELQKLLSTYIDNLPALVGEDGRLHATFLQDGTTTGRMASQNPNLQNIPIRTELGRAVRNAFIAEKGFVLFDLDYSQIELRVSAALSGDKKMIAIFKEGKDIHTAVASEVFGVSEGEVDREMRRRAKVINFGIHYGMGVVALQKQLGTNRKEAQTFLNEYLERFKGLAENMERMKGEARTKGYTETFFGRRRYLPGIVSKVPYIRAEAERMAINAPIQGTQADIVKLAMSAVHEWIEKEGLRDAVYLILQIHDELVFEVRSDLIDEVAPKIKAIMEHVIAPEDFNGIPLVADASAGENWGQLEKI